MDYFPQNTVTSYTTHLPKQIRLEGDEWEIALVEAHYPCSFMTVGKNARITIDYTSVFTRTTLIETEHVVAKLKSGYYRNITALLEEINTNADIVEFLEMTYDKDLDRVRIRLLNTNVTKFSLSHELALQLGFDNIQYELMTNITELIGLWAPNLLMGLPAHIYVYCDLVEPQLIGDTTAPLLKIVNIDRERYAHGVYKSVIYTTPHYVPVVKTTFDTIEVDLRDHTGEKLPFIFGTSYVKLHFKRVLQQQ